MLTHNVNPEHGQNRPKYQQVYKAAMTKGYAHGDRVPVISRKRRENLEIPASVLKEMKQRNPIMPKKYEEPANEDEYTDGSDNEWDFSHLEKMNKKNRSKNKDKKIDFHPKKNQPKEETKDDRLDEEDVALNPKETEGEDRDQSEQSEQPDDEAGYMYERGSHAPIPQPGTVEYKRMLEQFLRNPDKVKKAVKEGDNLQDMFPFCFEHNCYGQQLPNHELDPRNYKFLPAEYTKRIAPAGKNTLRGDQLYSVILPVE